MSNSKLSFSLQTNKKKRGATNTTANGPAHGFEPVFEDPPVLQDHEINPDLLKAPLVIPVQKDARQTLQEQARLRREEQQLAFEKEAHPDVERSNKDVSTNEDQAAIEALNAQAGTSTNDAAAKSANMVIQGVENTFQRKDEKDDSETQQFQQDLERLAPEISVDSQVYRQVPIADFGAAMLRGMGWTGQVDKSDADAPNMPRPSRLGLGATPKLLDAPTHGRKPRRQDQVKRDELLKQQQEEFEQQRLHQLKLDKQRTIQDGSIVRIQNGSSSRLAIIRKWQGVPGLNMTLVHFEGDRDPVKIKKGDVELVDRGELQENPFREPKYDGVDKVEFLGDTNRRSKDRERRRSEDKDRPDQYDKDRRSTKRNRDSDERSSNDDRRRSRDRHSEDRRDKKRGQDRDRHDDHKRHRSSREGESRLTATWLIPHIRVRVVTSKLGKQYYKEKAVVVDVTRKGTATLTMLNGQVLQAPERYLETALPKVGGNVCILTGEHRMAKGKLLERDTRANRGAIQVFEDMNIVTTSLDDIAEWCGPLDDDLME